MLTLALLAMGVTGANAEKVYADLSKLSNGPSTTWDVTTSTMTWTQQSNNMISNFDFPSGDYSTYEKIVVSVSDLNNAIGIRVQIRANGTEKTVALNGNAALNSEEVFEKTLTTDFGFTTGDLVNLEWIRLLGSGYYDGESHTINTDNPASAKINYVYLEKSDVDPDAEEDKVYATFESPTGITWDAETKTFSWTSQYGNQLHNIGLPNGNLSEYEKLVVDCEIKSGNGYRFMFYATTKGTTAGGTTIVTSSGKHTYKLADFNMDADYLTQCSEICLSGYDASGSVKVNSVYLVKSSDPLAGFKKSLTDVITEAQGKNSYAKTTASWNALTEALTAAEEALVADGATQESLETATANLNNAINGLQLQSGYSSVRPDMFHKWTTPDADAEKTDDAVYPANEVGKEIGQGTTILGLPGVHYLEYANLTGCNKLVIVGTPGLEARLLLNREADENNNGPYIELVEALDENGVLIIDLKNHDKLKNETYIHLNSFKTPYNGKTGVFSDVLVQYDYSITGDLTGGWGVDADMTATETEGEYTLTVENFKANAQEYNYKLRGAHQWDFVYQLPATDNYTWTCDHAGTYNLTFTANVYNNTLNLEATKVINSMTIVGFTPDTEDAVKWNPTNGIAMTQDANDPAIWTAVVEKYAVEKVNNSLYYQYKAVANGAFGEFECPVSGNQNYDFASAGEGMYKLTFTANTTAKSVELAVEKLPTATVYFVNDYDWTPRIWVWDANNGDYNYTGGDWNTRPTMTATGEQIDGKDVYTWSTYELNPTPTTLIISNGNNDSERIQEAFVDGATYRANGSSSVTKTISAAGYATYCSTSALDFSESGLTAYIAKKDASNNVTFQTVTTVPANTGVLLKGTAGEHTIKTVASSDTNVDDNALIGVTKETVVNKSGIFVLLNGDKGVGFYKTTASSFTVGANTAYIDALAGARSFIGFDEATAIDGIAAEKQMNGEVYNLQGQRVVKAQKGLYIINGKKVIVK